MPVRDTLDPEDDEVVVSLVVGEGEEAKIIRDFAEEEEQRAADLSDAALFEQSATLQIEVIGSDPAPDFGEHLPPYE